MKEPAKIRCTIIEEREMSLWIEQKQPRGGTLRVWIPRSPLDHISKREGEMTSTIEMPEWLAEAKGLDCE
jgi:hypothetical protein